ncbi:MAG: hypothetical protein J6U93_01775 [Alistipes sp.]|nr:hypothetical protein [Alistipes sp.]
MGYYRVLSCLENRRYIVENLKDGSQREMKIKYADIVRIKEDDTQSISAISHLGYVPVSEEIHFVVGNDGNAVYPIEEKLCALSETQTKKIKTGNIVEFSLTDGTSYLCRVESTSVEQGLLCVKILGDSIEHKFFVKDIVLSSIKVLVDGYRPLADDVLVMKGPNGGYYQFESVAKTLWYNSSIEPGQVMCITSNKDFTLLEVARELGVKLPDVKNFICNILPDDIKIGVGINSSVLDLRKRQSNIENDSDVTISSSEFYRLIEYLNRPDTQFKSIIHWEFYVNKKYPGVAKYQYLMNCDPYRYGVPYQNLDMDKFVNLIEWLNNKSDLNTDIVSYFPLFPLLYWSEQIRFVRRVVSLHKTSRHRISDLNLLERLVEYPKQVNINVLIFIHSILKLYREKKTLYNAELYQIWKSNQPDHIDSTFGLALNDYIGINLFCVCHGAIGFNVEDWWKPNVYSGNKPILYIYGDGTMGLRTNDNNSVEATMESVKKHKGFVVFREDVNSDEGKCFGDGQCPVLTAINEDSEYRNELLKTINITPEQLETDGYLMDALAFNNCPLSLVPSWRNKWAEKHRDKCKSNTPPRIKAIYLWHKRNAKTQHLFCEGLLSKSLHQKAGMPFSWCSGNACFTNLYKMPEVTMGNTIRAGELDIYSASVYLDLISDDDKSKLLLQRFHSRLNWLNVTAKHLYCRSCNHILEAMQTTSNYSAHTVSLFTCQNSNCSQCNKRVYLSHCWNDKCRSVIDSRDTSQCPLRKYICPSCGVCCGEKMFELKRQAGVSYKSLQYHYEQNKFFCYKCGMEMTKQGNRYYCKDHPEVVTRFNNKTQKV